MCKRYREEEGRGRELQHPSPLFPPPPPFAHPPGYNKLRSPLARREAGGTTRKQARIEEEATNLFFSTYDRTGRAQCLSSPIEREVTTHGRGGGGGGRPTLGLRSCVLGEKEERKVIKEIAFYSEVEEEE